MMHGFNGSPNGGWSPWLMGELANNDIWSCSLAMPTPDAPVKEEWMKTINDAVKEPIEEIFLVGHSLSATTILRYLESLPKGSKIGGVVLVSGPILKIEKEGYENVNRFLEQSFDFEHIKNSCSNFAIVHGDNDKSVPFSEAEYLASKFSCDLISVKNGGHLNGSAGWNKLPQVLESLLKMINVANS